MMRVALRELYWRSADGTILHVLAADSFRRLRALAVFLSDTGFRPDRPRPALDSGAVADLHADCLDPWKSPGRAAGYFRNSRALKLFGVVAMGFHPIPYYIIAFVLLIVFGFLWPILPTSGGAATNILPGFTADFIFSVLRHSILPGVSIVLVGIGGWFMGMRALVSNVVTEDYVVYAELGGVKRSRILPFYVMRNALMPQVTGTMSLGAIFNGAIIVEYVFAYPGLGRLLISAVYAGDYGLVSG